MLNTTGLPLTLPKEPPEFAVIMVMLKGSWPMTITNLPAPVWMASADNCSGAMVVYSCCWFFLGRNQCGRFLDLGHFDDLGIFHDAFGCFS